MSNRDLILVPFLLLLLNYVHGEETSLGLSSIEHERKFPLFIPTLKPIGAPSQPINGNDWRRRPFSNLPLWKNGLAAVGKHIFSDKYKNFLPSLSNPDTEDMLLEPCPARCTPFRFVRYFVRIFREIITIPAKIVEIIYIIWTNIIGTITKGGKLDFALILQTITEIRKLIINFDLPNIDLIGKLRPGTFLFEWVQFMRKMFRLPLRILLRFVGIVIPDTGIEGLRGLARLVMELLSRVVRILGFMRDGKPTIVIIKEIAPIFNIFGVPTKLTELLMWLGWKNDDHGINPLPLPWTPNIMEIIRNIIFGQFPSWKNMLTMILQWLKWIQSMTGSNRWIQWIIQIIITITGGDNPNPEPIPFPVPTDNPDVFPPIPFPWPPIFPDPTPTSQPDPIWPTLFPDTPTTQSPIIPIWPTLFPDPSPTLQPDPIWPTLFPDAPTTPAPIFPFWPPWIPRFPTAAPPNTGLHLSLGKTWVTLKKPKSRTSADINRDDKNYLAGPAGGLTDDYVRRGQICWILQPITWILQVFRTLSMGLFESFDVTLNVLNNSLRRIIQIFLPGLGPGFDIVAILPRIVRVLFGNPTGYLKIFTQSWLRFFGFNKPEQIIVLIRKTLPWVPTQLLYAIAPMISGIFPSATAKPNVPWIRPDWDTREGIWYPPTFPSPVLRKLDLPSSDFESGPAAEIDPLEEMQAIETGPAAAIETDKAVDETGPAAELEAVRAFDELGPAAALKTDERFGALGPAAALETEEGFGELGPAAALETEEGFGESGPAAASETDEATAIDESGPASIPFRVFKPNYDIPLPPSPYYNYYYPWFTKQGQGNPWLRNPWLRNRGSGYSSKKKNKDEKCNESVDGASTKPVLDLNTPTVTKN